MDDATTAFESDAYEYDNLRHRLVPCLDSLYGAATMALRLADRRLRRILDLGAGTGLLSARVAAAHPDAELVLLDASPAMLEQARAVVGPRARLCLADLRDPITGGPFDAAVSALAIHHLDDHHKRDLFARVHKALATGGVFVNAEQVAGPSPWLDARYRAHHREASAALGTTAEQWQAAEERMALDRCAPTEIQLEWLRDAGFTDVDCLFKDYGFALLFARAG